MRFIKRTGNADQDARQLVCGYVTLTDRQQETVFDLVNGYMEKNAEKYRPQRKGIVVPFRKTLAGDDRNIPNE